MLKFAGIALSSNRSHLGQCPLLYKDDRTVPHSAVGANKSEAITHADLVCIRYPNGCDTCRRWRARGSIRADDHGNGHLTPLCPLGLRGHHNFHDRATREAIATDGTVGSRARVAHGAGGCFAARCAPGSATSSDELRLHPVLHVVHTSRAIREHRLRCRERRARRSLGPIPPCPARKLTHPRWIYVWLGYTSNGRKA